MLEELEGLETRLKAITDVLGGLLEADGSNSSGVVPLFASLLVVSDLFVDVLVDFGEHVIQADCRAIEFAAHGSPFFCRCGLVKER